MLCTGSCPLAIKQCQVGTAGSVRIMALKKVFAALFMKVYKNLLCSLYCCLLFAFLNWDMLQQRNSHSPTLPVLTSLLRSSWCQLKWDLAEDSFRRKK